MKQRNFIGRLVSRLRNQHGWTQDRFADELQHAGWHDATRDTVAKIECGGQRIDLNQVCYLITALEIQPMQFLSEIDWNKQIEDTLYFENQQPVESYGHRK
ncbi:MAG TPA: helix-turn-helix domain-containing protein [Candidatus Baltobacteraceae bacterium]|nr:helix-turn-helix domain-containing protein [Candidatus Baltobacteraceae bacterium]